jgi:hypothetical protein
MILSAAYYFPVHNSLQLSCAENDASSSGSNDHQRPNHRQSHHSLLARDDFFRSCGCLSGFAHYYGQISKTHQVREGKDAAL